MSQYPPPTSDAPIFDSARFLNIDEALIEDLRLVLPNLSAVAPNNNNPFIFAVNNTLNVKNADSNPTGSISIDADNSATDFGMYWASGGVKPFVMTTLDATQLQVRDTTLSLYDTTGTPNTTNLTADSVEIVGGLTKTWADILAGAGSVGTLNSVLANGNTATGTYAHINLVDTNAGGIANAILNLQNSNATGSVAMEVYKNKPTAGVNGDVLFTQSVFGKDSGNAKQEFTRINHTIRDVTAGVEDGSIEFGCFVNGAVNTFLQINGNENEVNLLRPLDMTGNNIRTATGSLTVTSVGSSGTGDLTLSAKNTATLTGLGVAITSSGSAGEKITLTAPSTTIDLVPSVAILTDSKITTRNGFPTNIGSTIDFLGNPDSRFTITDKQMNLHWNDAISDQADITLENDAASLNSVIVFNYQTTGGNMGTTIQNTPAIQRITQTDGINNKSYESSPNKVELIEGAGRQAKIENSVNSGENRMDLFINGGGGISAQSGIVQQIGTQSLYLTSADNSTGKAINLTNIPTGSGTLSYTNTADTSPLIVESVNTGLILSALGGSANIELTTGSSVVFTGANLESNSSTGSSGKYLVITLNGTTYKIPLDNN